MGTSNLALRVSELISMGIGTARPDTGVAGGAGVAPIGGSGGGKRP